MKLYGFMRETVDAERIQIIADGDMDGFTASEVAVRVFSADARVSTVVCEVQHYHDRTPFRLVTVMPGAWESADQLNAPNISAAVEEIRALNLAAVELLPPTLI